MTTNVFESCPSKVRPAPSIALGTVGESGLIGTTLIKNYIEIIAIKDDNIHRTTIPIPYPPHLKQKRINKFIKKYPNYDIFQSINTVYNKGHRCSNTLDISWITGVRLDIDNCDTTRALELMIDVDYSKAEIKETGTGIHVIFLFDHPVPAILGNNLQREFVEKHLYADQEGANKSSIVKTRLTGSINQKNNTKVVISIPSSGTYRLAELGLCVNILPRDYQEYSNRAEIVYVNNKRRKALEFMKRKYDNLTIEETQLLKRLSSNIEEDCVKHLTSSPLTRLTEEDLLPRAHMCRNMIQHQNNKHNSSSPLTRLTEEGFHDVHIVKRTIQHCSVSNYIEEDFKLTSHGQHEKMLGNLSIWLFKRGATEQDIITIHHRFYEDNSEFIKLKELGSLNKLRGWLRSASRKYRGINRTIQSHPGSVILNGKRNLIARQVADLACSLQGENGDRIFLPISVLSSRFGISKPAACKLLRKLVKLGLLDRVEASDPSQRLAAFFKVSDKWQNGESGTWVTGKAESKWLEEIKHGNREQREPEPNDEPYYGESDLTISTEYDEPYYEPEPCFNRERELQEVQEKPD